MKLLPPKGTNTRPITDRVKESLFSVLYKYDLIPDGTVADVFCGTGSLGLEALSRGASHVTFVDKDPSATAILEQNIEKARFVAQSKVIRANAFKVGAPLDITSGLYDLVFVDPPYVLSADTSPSSPLAGMLNLICSQTTAGAVVVVRTAEYTTLLDCYGPLHVIDRRTWGAMSVTLLSKDTRKEPDDQPQAGD
jgi:16S rRNA (guanine966-N2)-methyltransferase